MANGVTAMLAQVLPLPQAEAGLKIKLVYRLGPRMMKKLTGCEPQTGSGMEPMEIWAYQPKMMMGMGKFNQAVRKGKSVDDRLKNLIELKGAQMIGCEFCVDLGSHFRDEQLVEITALLTLVNLDRFNAAFGIGSAGFSDGMVCVPPDRPAADPALRRIA